MAARSARSRQLSLSLPVPRTWGGKRAGAGRKRVASRPLTPHRARPPQASSHPVLITLRACFRPLRSQHVLPTLRLAIAGANRREPERFRITHSTVQYDHIHLIVEAVDQQALSSGMSSVTIRIARSVNALVGRRGRFWADRWYGRALTTPRQVRTALVYVLRNASHCTSFSAGSAHVVSLPRSHGLLWHIVRGDFGLRRREQARCDPAAAVA